MLYALLRQVLLFTALASAATITEDGEYSYATSTLTSLATYEATLTNTYLQVVCPPARSTLTEDDGEKLVVRNTCVPGDPDVTVWVTIITTPPTLVTTTSTQWHTITTETVTLTVWQ